MGVDLKAGAAAGQDLGAEGPVGESGRQAPGPSLSVPGRRRVERPGERAVPLVLALFGLASIGTTAGIVLVLVTEAVAFFRHVPVLEFLTGTRWTPLFVPRNFGVLPLVNGTLLVAAGAALVALPVGLATAVYLSEYAPTRVRRGLKPVLEVLAGVPTVVYGYFALTLVTPALRAVFPSAGVFNAASASLAMAVMILPMVASLSEDAMRAVPDSLRQGAFALGATRLEVATGVVLPAAFSGVAAACLLAVSRAVGETMIVAIAAGATARLTWNPLDSVQTMTGYLVQVSLGDTPHGSVEYQTLFAVGLLLFVMTLFLNLAARAMVGRFRQVYR